MKRKYLKRIGIIFATALMITSLVACGTTQKSESEAEVSSKVETESETKTETQTEPQVKLDENAIQDFYTGLGDVYVLQDATDVNYLHGILFDNSVVVEITVDDSNIDTTKEGTYKLIFNVVVDRSAYDKYVKVENTDTDKLNPETIKVEKEVTVIDKEDANELADKNEIVLSSKDETVSKTDGTKAKEEQKAPASTTETNGSSVDSKGEVQKPTITEKPTVVTPAPKPVVTPKPDVTSKPATSSKPVVTPKPETSSKPTVTSKPTTTPEPQKPIVTTKPTTTSKPVVTPKPETSSTPVVTPKPPVVTPKPETSSKPVVTPKPTPEPVKPTVTPTPEPQKPAHEHSYTIPIIEKIHHPAETHEEPIYETKQVVVKPAYTEKKETKGQHCSQCDYWTSSPEDMTMHCLLNGHSCHIDNKIEYIEHPAVTETQKVQTGTKTVVDKEAWVEEKTVGYKCECGAVK